MTELDKLEAYLKEHSIVYRRYEHLGGEGIWTDTWDAICAPCSYGGDRGLLEIYGSIVDYDDYDTVAGYLTADDVIARVEYAKVLSMQGDNLETRRDFELKCLDCGCTGMSTDREVSIRLVCDKPCPVRQGVPYVYEDCRFWDNEKRCTA